VSDTGNVAIESEEMPLWVIAVMLAVLATNKNRPEGWSAMDAEACPTPWALVDALKFPVTVSMG
jgi:hypothetical protein